MNHQLLLEAKNPDNFLENIQHDLCTPLTGIIGFAKRIQQQSKEPHIQQYADMLTAATNALLHFQKDFFQEEIASSAAFDFRVLIEEVIALSMPSAVLKKLKLSYCCDSTIPKKIITDRHALFRILLELTTNAIKFTENGSVQWRFSLTHGNNKHFMLHCDITDTGRGILKKNHKKVFDRFYQAGSEKEGEGLGLSIVKSLLQHLQGCYRLQSKVGSGTAIFCDIPIKMVCSKKINNRKVLLIEDHVMTANAMQYMLEDCNCEVDIATNLSQVALQMKSTLYDFIFLDMHLPNKNSAIAIAKHIQKVSKHITPIIGITAGPIKEKNLMFDVVLEKPLSAQKIQAVIEDDRFRMVDFVLGAKRLGRKEKDAKEFLKAIVDAFTAERAAWLKAIKQKNKAALKNKNHRLLGALRYCGAPALEFVSSDLHKNFDHFDDHIALLRAKKIVALIDKTKSLVQ